MLSKNFIQTISIQVQKEVEGDFQIQHSKTYQTANKE